MIPIRNKRTIIQQKSIEQQELINEQELIKQKEHITQHGNIWHKGQKMQKQDKVHKMQKKHKWYIGNCGSYDQIKLRVLLILAGSLLLMAAFAAHLTPYDPYAQDLSCALSAPGPSHILGTDRYGRDFFSRVLMGAQTTLFTALLLTAAVTAIGTSVGMICGYYDGRLDALLMRLSDVFLAFPGMVFAIAAAGVLQGGLMSAVIALACISWPKYARLTRSQVLAIKEEPFIAAARLSGTGTFKMMWTHILPNIAGTVIVTAVLDIGTLIMELAGLSFLGLGVTPPIAEWGAMMSDGRSMLQTAPWVVMAPGMALFISVSLFNLLGDALRDRLDPKSKAEN